MSDLSGQVLDGRYELLRPLDRGGMATIYVARQLNISREVAVKILNPLEAQEKSMVERFKSEARIISELRHPNTLKLIDHGTTPEGTLYIVTELLQGQPLSELLRKGPLDPRRALQIVRQVSLSLAEAHAKGIVHRDLKPGNIFLEDVGGQEIVKVLDFGIAKATKPQLQDDGQHRTVAGTLIGTPAYMSPEQAEGQPVTPQSDLYCLGVVAYHCLTGVVPFPGQPIAQIAAHAMDPIPPFEKRAPKLKIDPRIEALVMRLLEKKPQARPKSATELAQQVEVLLSGSAVIPAPPPPGSKRGLMIALLLLGLIGAGGLAAFIAQPKGGAQDAGPAQDAQAVLTEDAQVEDAGEPFEQQFEQDAGAPDLAQDLPPDLGAEDLGGLLHRGEDGIALIEVERQGFAEDADFGALLDRLKRPLLDCFELGASKEQVYLRFAVQRSSTSFSVSPENEQLRRCIAINLPRRLRWPRQTGPAAIYTISIAPPGAGEAP